jgi:uncharacterized membrane protein HdeD (DUF308 family)
VARIRAAHGEERASEMKIIGIVLVILGVIALFYGGIEYNKDRTVLKLGDVSITAEESKSIPIPAVIGAAVLLGGIALIVVDRRRPRSV